MLRSFLPPLAPEADAELVSASRAGNRDAFGQIVARYQSLVCSVAYSATGSLSQSEDLAQETFLAAWKHLDQLREPGKLRSWLCGIARHVTQNSLRAQERDPAHRAQPMEDLRELMSLEPLPPETAVRQEEAQILWRSLHRIPENYRLPMVLYYREHQSMEAVAHHLDLTEEAVRQRLSRGRKLLQEEVLSFVESALERSSPGKAFTLTVMAALPLGVQSAEAATLGVVAAKGSLGAKAALIFGTLGGWLGMLAAVGLSWKTAADAARSRRQRTLIVRWAWIQTIGLIAGVSLAIYLMSLLGRRPILAGGGLGLLLLSIMIISVVAPGRLSARLTAIALEDGIPLEGVGPGPSPELDREASRKAVRWLMPMLLMMAVGLPFMPWRDHWARCALVTGAELAVLAWAFHHYRKTLTFPMNHHPPGSAGQRFVRHPLVLVPAILVGSGLLGALLPFFLHPGPVQPPIPRELMRTLGLVVLGTVLVYMALAVFGRGLMRASSGAGMAGAISSGLRSLGTPDPHAVAAEAYAAFFEQTIFPPDQRSRLIELMVERVMAQTRATWPLMNRKLDRSTRARMVDQLRHSSDDAEAKIRELLGADMQGRLHDYERTLLDRTRVKQFDVACSEQGIPLQPKQLDELFEALFQARSQYPWTTNLGRRDEKTGCDPATFTPANISRFIQEEEDFDRELAIRAEAILNPQQLAAFVRLRSVQRSSQIAQINMAARLFAPPV
ncbi:MAG: sigma-70 family RNA polymerase sigma factor [Verrucomicrobiota bacterium]